MKLSKLKSIIKEAIKLQEQGPFGNTLRCDESDFQYNSSPCGQTWLVPAPGGQNSWTTWLINQTNAYLGSAGCYQFGAIQTWIGQQLASGVNAQGVPFSQTAIARKQAKSDWAACMMDHCCDPDPIDDPCKDFLAAPQQMQDACCQKYASAIAAGQPGLNPNDPCYTLTNDGKCCPDDPDPTGDERGCMDPNAVNYMTCCPQNNYPGCVPNSSFDGCCKYDDDPTDPCKQFATLPQAQQDGCCEKCQGNISPQDPCYQYCKCCDPDPTGDDPCVDNPNPSCFWCHQETSQGGPCVPVGGNLQYALNNGFNLYSNWQSCTAAEPGCSPRRGPTDPDMPVDLAEINRMQKLANIKH
jgi:hypothetical protein